MKGRIKLTEKQLANITRKIVKEDNYDGKDFDKGLKAAGRFSDEEFNNITSRSTGMEKDISRDDIIEILNEIYELQLDKAPAIAQRRLDELFEKVGIGYWSYPSPEGR